MYLRKWIKPIDAAVLLGVLAAAMLANFAAFGQECDAVRTQVVRLHILANSDSEADQAVKLKVRDQILKDVGGVFTLTHNKPDAKLAAQRNLPQIRQAARKALLAAGEDMPVRVELTNMYFTTREYDDISLPAGYYDAVRVTLGAGDGKNWWCVMYPPMCVSAAMHNEELDEMEGISHLNSQPLFKPKLAVVELFEQITQQKEQPETKDAETEAAETEDADTEASEINVYD